MSIKSRLLTAFGIVLVLLAALAVIAITRLSHFNASLRHMVDVTAEAALVPADMRSEIEALAVTQSRLTMLPGAPAIAEADEEFAAHVEELARLQARLEEIAEPADLADLSDYALAMEPVKGFQQRLHDLALAGVRDPARRQMTQLEAIRFLHGPAAAALDQAMDALVRIETRKKALMAEEKATAEAIYGQSRMILLVATLATLAIGITAAVWMAQVISGGIRRAANIAAEVARGNPRVDCTPGRRDEIGELLIAMGEMNARLSAMARAADTIADGDLTVEVRPRSPDDQLGLSLQRMVGTLRSVMAEVSANARSVAESAKAVNDTSERLKAGSSQQASAAEEASAAMEEMSSNIRHSTANAEQTEKIASQASAEARDSGEAVAKAVDAMKTIAGKITIVQEIARQTDLLALNAAVEAARAGSHGKGFAVVASEVRKLAERSQTAASEIGQLSAETLRVSETAGQKLTELLPSIQRTSDLVREISAATREQSIGADQINQAIQDLDAVIQQNAASAASAAEVSRDLADQSSDLRGSIAHYRIGNTDAPPQKSEGSETSRQPARTGPKSKTPAKSPARSDADRTAQRQAGPDRPDKSDKAGKPAGKHGATEQGYELDLFSDDIPDSEFEPMPKAS